MCRFTLRKLTFLNAIAAEKKQNLHFPITEPFVNTAGQFLRTIRTVIAPTVRIYILRSDVLERRRPGVPGEKDNAFRCTLNGSTANLHHFPRENGGKSTYYHYLEVKVYNVVHYCTLVNKFKHRRLKWLNYHHTKRKYGSKVSSAA